MSSQPAKEWDDMTETQRTEITNRLHAAVEDVNRAAYRAALARASRSHYPQAADRA